MEGIQGRKSNYKSVKMHAAITTRVFNQGPIQTKRKTASFSFKYLKYSKATVTEFITQATVLKLVKILLKKT